MASGVIISALILNFVLHLSSSHQPNSIIISVVCERASTSKNKAKFLELPLDELEKSYDPEWLKSKVVSCRTLNYMKTSSPFLWSWTLVDILPIARSKGSTPPAGRTKSQRCHLLQPTNVEVVQADLFHLHAGSDE